MGIELHRKMDAALKFWRRRECALKMAITIAILDTMTYSVAEAKNRLPELIKQAEAGERVTITKRGIPVVEIVRKSDDVRRKPVFGVLGNKKVVIDPDWARPQEDIEAWLAGDV
ncbi:MAG: type II toxin-antitoxin system Phd/YefM family antitoxin [Terriglobia bacterium]